MEENENIRSNFNNLKKRIVSVAKLVDNNTKHLLRTEKAEKESEEYKKELTEMKEKLEKEREEMNKKYENEKEGMKKGFENQMEEHEKCKKDLEKLRRANVELTKNDEVKKAFINEKKEHLASKKDFEKKIEGFQECKKELEKSRRTIVKNEKMIEEISKENDDNKTKIESYSGLVNANKALESLKWQHMSEIEKYRQEKAGNEEDVVLQKNVMTNLKKQNTKYLKQLKSTEKKLKEYETVENDKDDVIQKGLERDKKLHNALDEIKRLKQKVQELEKNREIVDLDGSCEDLAIVDSIPKKENVQPIKSEPTLIKKKTKGSIFSMFQIKTAKPKKIKTERRKTPFLLLKKIKPSAGILPEISANQEPTRVVGLYYFSDPSKPVFNQLGHRHHEPIYDIEANIINEGKTDPDDLLPAASKTTHGSKRKINTESTPETPQSPLQKKRLKVVPTSAEANLPKEISPIKSPGRFSLISKTAAISKKPMDTSTPCRSLTSSAPMDQTTQVQKHIKKQPSEEVSISPKILTPKATTNSEEPTISPSKILSPNMSKARARLVSSFNLNPHAIEPIKKGDKVNKLTPAQLEAVKQRTVGRAAPGVASRPSVDGFRASEPLVKPNKQKPSEDVANVRVRWFKPRSKASGIEELDSCPTRKSTQPCKMNSVSKARKESTIVTVDANPDDEMDYPDTPTRSGRQRRFPPPDHQLPRQESKPISDNADEKSNAEIVIVHDPKQSKIVQTPQHPVVKNDVKIEDFNQPGKANETNSVSESTKTFKSDVADIDKSAVTETDMEPESGMAEPISEMVRHASMESLEDDLNLSDCSDDCADEDLREDEVSMKSEVQEESTSDNDDESDKPVNRRKRKLSQSEPNDEKPNSISHVSNGVKEETERKPVKEEIDRKPAIHMNQKPVATKAPKNLLAELLVNYKARHEKKEEELEAKRAQVMKERESFAREAFLQCLRKNFGCYKGSQNKDSFARIIDGISTGSTNSDEEAICDLVFEEIKSQPNDEPTLDQLGEGKAPLTRLEQRLFVLLDALRKKERFSGIMDRMIKLLRHGLFARDHMYSMRRNILCGLMRMLVLCMRRLNYVDQVKELIFDLLYFKSPRNHLLIGVCFMLVPQIFSQWNNPARNNPVEKTIAWMIFNTGVAAPEMMVNEIRADFRNSFRYPPNMGVRAEDLIKEFMSMAEKKATQVRRLDQLRQCLITIGRAHPYPWVNNNIVQRLWKILGKVMNKGFGVEQAKHLRIWVIKCLGCLSRQFVVDATKDRTEILQQFDGLKAMLSKVDELDLSPELENAAVSCFVDHGHHLQRQVAEHFSTWKPKHQLFPETLEKLEDFVGTRGRKHADITSFVLGKNEEKKIKLKIRQQMRDREEAERQKRVNAR